MNTGKTKTKVILAIVSALSLSVSTALYAIQPLGVQATDNPLSVVASSPLVKRFIIKYKQAIHNHVNSSNALDVNTTVLARIAAIKKKLKKLGAKVQDEYPSLNMLSVELEESDALALSFDVNVDYVEEDLPRRFMAQTLPYGMAMVQADQIDDSITSANAVGKKICIIDSGLNAHHVAGTLATLNNDIAVNRVISSDANIYIVNVFDNSGWGYSSALVSAIDSCVSHGSDIINMSLGGPGSSISEKNAIQAAYDAGVLLIAAAGNEGGSASSTNVDSYPASYNSVMSVAAFDGAAIINTLGLSANINIDASYYGKMSVTSMASSHVAGIAALVWSHHSTCTNAEIRKVLNTSAQDLGAIGRDVKFGHGLEQTKNAIDYITANGCNVSDTESGEGLAANDTVLKNGVVKSNLSATTGNDLIFTMEVPAGATDINISTTSGRGDADLQVKFGALPTDSVFDCRPYKTGNIESCASIKTGGTYYVRLKAYTDFTDVSLTASYSELSTADDVKLEPIDTTVKNIAISKKVWTRYTYDLLDGYADLTVSLSSGSGDADLYVTHAKQSQKTAYDCRPYKKGNNETCNLMMPAKGLWHIDIYADSTASGIALNVKATPQ